MHKPYGPIENTLDCIVQGHASLDCAIHDISQKIVELGTFVDQVTLKEVCYPRIWSNLSKYANAIAATRSFRSEASWTSQHKPKFSSWTSTMHHLQIIITKLERGWEKLPRTTSPAYFVPAKGQWYLHQQVLCDGLQQSKQTKSKWHYQICKMERQIEDKQFMKITTRCLLQVFNWFN